MCPVTKHHTPSGAGAFQLGQHCTQEFGSDAFCSLNQKKKMHNDQMADC
jgi:hypothetical protein